MPSRLAHLALASAAALAVTTAAAPAAHAGNGVDLMKFMPDDAMVYVVVDVAGARDSDLFKKGMAKLMSSQMTGVAQIKATGIDPATAFDTIAFAGAGTSFDHFDANNVFLVAEGPAAKKIADAIAKGGKLAAKAYHGVTYWADADNSVALVAKKLVLAKPANMERAIDLALGKVKSAARGAKAAALRAVVGATDTRQDVWAAMVIPADAAKAAKAAGVEVTGMSFGASLGKDLALEVKVLNATEASATTMAALVGQQLPKATGALGQFGLAGAAKSLVVDQDGPTVRIAMSLTEQELKTVATLMGSFGGGFGGP